MKVACPATKSLLACAAPDAANVRTLMSSIVPCLPCHFCTATKGAYAAAPHYRQALDGSRKAGLRSVMLVALCHEDLECRKSRSMLAPAIPANETAFVSWRVKKPKTRMGNCLLRLRHSWPGITMLVSSPTFQTNIDMDQLRCTCFLKSLSIAHRLSYLQLVPP
jgi:hypothetical protein